MVTIKVNQSRSSGEEVVLDTVTDECPLCHHKILPSFIYGVRLKDEIQGIFVCPSGECQKLFISYYTQPGTLRDYQYRLRASRPYSPISKGFSQEILDISSNFCEIYREAFIAEQYHLKLVCGAGYRKALEFLIKDYLIKEFADKADEIKSPFS
jgi:hypothetical protein